MCSLDSNFKLRDIASFVDALQNGALDAVKTIALYHSPIGDAGLRAIGTLLRAGGTPALERLVLTNVGAGDNGVGALAADLAAAPKSLRLKQIYATQAKLRASSIAALTAACATRAIKLDAIALRACAVPDAASKDTS